MNTIDIKTLQEELLTQTENTSLFITPGIHENVKLMDIVIKPTSTGVNVLQTTFEKENKRLYYTEWLDQEKTLDQKKKVMKSILQMLNAIVPRAILDTMVITEDLQDFAEKAILVINGFKGTVNLRLKAVYVKDKVTVPLHTRFAWIENMDVVKGEDSKIQMYPKDALTPQVGVMMPMAA
jgi:hypothetical protein